MLSVALAMSALSGCGESGETEIQSESVEEISHNKKGLLFYLFDDINRALELKCKLFTGRKRNEVEKVTEHVHDLRNAVDNDSVRQ